MTSMEDLVVLVQPETNILDRAKTRPTPPLPLLAAASRVARRTKVALVDVRYDRRGWRKILAGHLARKPICVGVTSVTGNQILSTLEVVRYVRSVSDVSVVWGGVHATLFPDQVLGEPSVDYVVRGEGEDTFEELVAALSAGKDVTGIRGLSHRRDGQIVHNEDRPFVNLDDLPEVPYELMGEEPYFYSQGKPTLYVETSRGCFSRCTYCYVSGFHLRRWRPQSASRVLERFDGLRRRWPVIRHLSLVDDNYFGEVKRMRVISEGLIERGSPWSYQVQGAHIQVVSHLKIDDFRLLARSGCERLDMGLESASTSMHKIIRKRIDLDAVRNMNRMLGEVGIVPWYNIMVGFPGETTADLDATRDYVMRLRDENPKALFSPFYRVVPYPGTELFATALEAGFEPPRSLEGWKNFHSDGADVPWQTRRGKKRISQLFFLTMFFDRKSEIYNTNAIVRLLARIYRPIAAMRLRRNWMRLMPEYSLFRLVFNAS
ncbi:MAG: B12-binding domain-containing radical SAM protein [Deltaproteobacteria bacterium]|nr:B12-binding domain-containing radical SAM protein [Deltaproteobacteria bacterium]